MLKKLIIALSPCSGRCRTNKNQNQRLRQQDTPRAPLPLMKPLRSKAANC